MFCPRCNGALEVLHVGIGMWVPTFIAWPTHAAACDTCSLVSEVSTEGRLIDLGNITLSECGEPFVPGKSRPRVFIQDGSTSLRRRDS